MDIESESEHAVAHEALASTPSTPFTPLKRRNEGHLHELLNKVPVLALEPVSGVQLSRAVEGPGFVKRRGVVFANNAYDDIPGFEAATSLSKLQWRSAAEAVDVVFKGYIKKTVSTSYRDQQLQVLLCSYTQMIPCYHNCCHYNIIIVHTVFTAFTNEYTNTANGMDMVLINVIFR